MKIMILGAGAVGGYFGALLQKAGQELFFIARGEHLKAIRERGLRIEGVTLNDILSVNASVDPAEFGEMDLIILCVKSQDTRSALERIEPCVAEETVILTLQNGVENEELISSKYGIERTIAGVAYIGVGVDAPGFIRNQTTGRIAVGMLVDDAGSDNLFADIVTMMKDAGIDLSVTNDIMKRKWGKLVWNAVFNPISVLTGRSSYRLKGDPEVRDLLEGIISEVISVAVSEGYELDFVEIVEKMFDMDRAVKGTKTSMLQDFEKGKPLEIEELNGAVMRIGKKNGVSTPINTSIVGLIRGKVGQRDREL